MGREKDHPFRCLNSNGLKLIAVLTMLADHIGVALIENYILGGPFDLNFEAIQASQRLSMWWNINMVLRFVGRLAFPIFCFQIVEGAVHTGNVRKYAGRLLVFAFVSEIPFDMAAFNTWFYPQYQNVYFTLFLGLTAIAGIRMFEKERFRWKAALVIAACCFTAHVLSVDYGVFGVCFIILLYVLRGNTRMQTVMGCLLMSWELTAPLAFIPIRMYNGARGDKRWQWFFYVFYPAHLLALALIRMGLGG